MYEFIYELIMSALRLPNLFRREKRKNKTKNEIPQWPTRIMRDAIHKELDERVRRAREDGSFQIFVTPDEYGRMLAEDGLYMFPSIPGSPQRFIPPEIAQYAGCEVRIDRRGSQLNVP